MYPAVQQVRAVSFMRTPCHKRALIEADHPTLSIRRQCELLNLSRSRAPSAIESRGWPVYYGWGRWRSNVKLELCG